MPLLASNYNPPFFFKNGHISTIYPNLLRKINGIQQIRERIELEDGDFIDLDWSYTSSKIPKKLAIVIHGLEGNAQRKYVKGLARYLNSNDWDVAGVNLRNCSGEVNRLYRSYNAGVSEDVDSIITHVLSKNKYQSISLCGFSLGGNIVLKYLGEGRTIPSTITSGIAISVPCDLYDSLTAINTPKNFIYQQRFMRYLKAKLYERQATFPDHLTVSEIRACKSLMDIDNLYTSRAHGYRDAMDYYTKCSSKQFLPNISIPTLILNARDDSFLGENCYPITEAKENPNLFLEIPKYGGHVGFCLGEKSYYHENRVLQFIEETGA